jgi:polyisoprenoid-binding protein YceI
MKKLMLITGLSVVLFSCKDAPKADEAEATQAQEVAATTGATYNADLQQSKVEWVGTKPTGRHHGTIGIKEGNLAVENGAITGGKFVMDMTTVQADDQDAEGNTKLTGHLKSDDFFMVDKHPTSTFEITSVTAGAPADAVMKDATHTITGNLTMKDITKSITFPAKVAMTDANITADAEFNIDRTQWNIVYQSDKSVQNKFISHEVNIKLHLVANK